MRTSINPRKKRKLGRGNELSGHGPGVAPAPLAATEIAALFGGSG